MSTNLRWKRRFPNSTNNFDLVLTNAHELDSEAMNTLLRGILSENHRGLSLTSRAAKEFERWFNNPDTPLKSEAYVLLSNWFLTQSGDRHSMVANGCEHLWDALFPCRPADRLSSPEPGRNHLMLPAEFDRFWQQVLEAQGDELDEYHRASSTPNIKPRGHANDLPRVSNGSTPDHLRAMFDKKGLHFEVEGPSRALADFLQIVSSWE